MKKFSPVICFVIWMLLLSCPSFSQVKADDVVGIWTTGSGDARVEIVKEGSKYYGSIVWLKDPLDENGKEKVDDDNPDPKMRSNKIIGLRMLKDFSFDGDEEWENGTIYDPKNGKTYSCVMELDGKNTLNVRGYIGFSWIGRTDTWTRYTAK